MSEIIAEQIVTKVKDRLAEINVADGYQFTTPEVVRPLRFVNNRFQNLQILVTISEIATNQSLSHPGNPPAIAKDMTVMCSCYGMVSKTDKNPADYWRNRIFGAMSKAITTGVAWWQWGGLAINTMVGNPIYRAEDGGANVGVQLPVIITFRTDEDDPFQVRA
jgi:hypothetical protein